MNVKTQKTLRAAALIALVSGLSGCAFLTGIEPPAFEGVRFKAKTTPTGEGDSPTFVVEVPKALRNTKGAREAGDYAATGYCLTHFGDSDHSWTTGPDGSDRALIGPDGVMTLRGTCAGW